MFRSPHFFSAWLSKFHSPPPLEHFEHKKFLKKKDFLSFSETEENVFSIVLKTCQARLSDTINKFTRKFWGENFIENVLFCHFIWTMIETFSVFVGQNSIGLSICILRVKKECGRKQKGTLKEIFWNLEEKSPPGLSQLQFTCSWEQFGRKNFLKQFQFSKIFVY